MEILTFFIVTIYFELIIYQHLALSMPFFPVIANIYIEHFVKMALEKTTKWLLKRQQNSGDM